MSKKTVISISGNQIIRKQLSVSKACRIACFSIILTFWSPAIFGQFTNQFGTSYHAYLPGPSSNSVPSGGGGPGQPYFDAANALSRIAAENIRRNNEVLNNIGNNQGLGRDYSSSELLMMQQNEIMRQNALAAQEYQLSPAQVKAQQIAQQKAAEAAKRAAEAEQKRIAKENAVVKQMYATADKAAADAQEDAYRKLEAQEYWKKASNNIWKANDKDPWKGFRDKMEQWESDSLNKMRDQNNRPWLNADGEITTVQEYKNQSDKQWLEQIKSPNAKKHP